MPQRGRGQVRCRLGEAEVQGSTQQLLCPQAGAGPASGPATAHGGIGDMARRRRYAINPLGHKWDHVNLTYR